MKMKKLFDYNIGKLLFAIIAMCVCSVSLVSCSDDDDNDGGGKFDPPAYEASAAKYEISDGSSPYESIEFTESGNYLVTMSGVTPAPAAAAKETTQAARGMAAMAKRPSIFANTAATQATRAYYSPILYGKYTVGADGTYILEGFGTVKVTQDGTGNSYTLEVTPDGGQTVTIEATRQNADLNSQKSNMLCRTWDMAAARLFFDYNGKRVIDVKGNSPEELLEKLRELAQKNDPDYDESDYDEIEDIMPAWPEEVVFTKTGTYVVYYTGQELAVSTWKWENEAQGYLIYSWYNNLDDPDGRVLVEFDGNNMQITESYTESYDGETETMGLTYYFTEAK